MSRIPATFERLRKEGRKALIPFVTAGDPEPSTTVPLMHAMVNAGADILELGVPFSDPMADGPVIQAACERALKHHLNLRGVLKMVKEFRDRNQTTPVVLMGYLNPVEVMGYEEFATAAQAAGVDGLLTVDMPPEEAEALTAELYKNNIDPVFLIAPTSSKERIKRIANAARGFVYYVSLKGVTGSASLDVSSVAEKVAEIRALTKLPIGVGFGIKDAASAAQIADIADAVIIGSAIVQRIASAASSNDIEKDVVKLLKDMRHAMDAVGVAAKFEKAI